MSPTEQLDIDRLRKMGEQITTLQDVVHDQRMLIDNLTRRTEWLEQVVKDWSDDITL